MGRNSWNAENEGIPECMKIKYKLNRKPECVLVETDDLRGKCTVESIY